MQRDAGQKARRSLGTDDGERISIVPAERSGAVFPLARVMAFWIRQGHTGGERRNDNGRRPKGLMDVNRKFIGERRKLSGLDRQEEHGTVLVLQLGGCG